MSKRRVLQLKILGILALLLIGFIGVFNSFNNYIYEKKQEPNPSPTLFTPERVSLIGEYTCLPHVDTGGPQTLECALGILTDDGNYYSVDFSLMSQEYQSIPTGSRISANGVLTPIERLSTDHWEKYDIEGIFSVTDSLEILSN